MRQEKLCPEGTKHATVKLHLNIGQTKKGLKLQLKPVGCKLPALASIVLGETGKGGVTVGRQGNMHKFTPCDTYGQGKSTTSTNC